MKKETVFAIFLGVVAGVGIATLIISQSREASLEKTHKSIDTISITPAVKLKSEPFQALSVETPIDQAIVHEDHVAISGKAPADSLVIIQSPYSEAVIKATDGTFQSDFDLTAGENTISITSYKQQQVETKNISVYFIEE
ncbi:MAG: hypothetical protein ACMG6E_01640 [Candidatus Roizmanbacteria bacterium]